MLGPFATAARRYQQQQQRRRRQRQRVTEGTAMAPWNGPNNKLEATFRRIITGIARRISQKKKLLLMSAARRRVRQNEAACVCLCRRSQPTSIAPAASVYCSMTEPCGQRRSLRYTVKNIRIWADILWHVFHILSEPVPYRFVSVIRRNNEGRGPHCSVDQCSVVPSMYVDKRE